MKMFLTRLGFGSKAVIAGIRRSGLPSPSPRVVEVKKILAGSRHRVRLVSEVDVVSTLVRRS